MKIMKLWLIIIQYINNKFKVTVNTITIKSELTYYACGENAEKKNTYHWHCKCKTLKRKIRNIDKL